MAWLHEILYVVVVATVPVVAKFLISYLETRRAEAQVKLEKRVFEDTVLETTDLIKKAVDTTSQTYVDSLKQSGKFDAEAQKEAFQRSFENVKTLLDNDSKQLLETAYSDLDKWIELQIESYIRSQKKEK